jgi:hypothetical protein
MKLKDTDQCFGLGINSNHKDYQMMTKFEGEKRMAWIKEHEPDDERMYIPYIHDTSPPIYIINPSVH